MKQDGGACRIDPASVVSGFKLFPGYSIEGRGTTLNNKQGQELSLEIDDFLLSCFVPYMTNATKSDYIYNCYHDSNEILKKCADGHIEYIYPRINYNLKVIYTHGDVRLFKIMTMAGFNIGQIRPRSIGPRTVLCAINMGRNIDEILEDIKSIHSMEVRGERHTPSREAIQRIGAKKGMISKLPKGDRDITRAIGIWLWDYLESKKMPYKFKAKAFSAFADKFQKPTSIPQIGGYRDTKQLTDLLELAHDCIEKVEVLPGT